MSDTQVTPAGWYDDGSGHQWWWDGAQWGQIAPAPPVANTPPPYVQTPYVALSGYAVTGLTLALISVLGLLLPTVFTLIFPAGAILFSSLGLWDVKRGKRRGQKLAAAGLVIGCVAAFIIFLIMMIIANPQG